MYMSTLDTEQLNETFELLTHPYRRFMLYYLTNESGAVSIDTLASAIAACNSRKDDRPTASDVIRISLQHVHLPVLEDAGIVSVADDGDTVALEHTDGLGQFLDETESLDGYTEAIADV